MSKRICVIGTGFVGLTIGIALALKDFDVTFIDKNEEVIERLKLGGTHVVEPGIESLIGLLTAERRISFITSSEFMESQGDFDVYIISVGTPIKDGTLDKSAIEQAAEMISIKLQNGNLVVMRSTVSIGISRKIVFEKLQKVAPRAFFATCPERTAEGVALKEILEIPQIVGGLNADSAEVASKFFSNICKEVVLVENPEAAELAKLASNTYRDLSFAYANDLARIAGKLSLNSGDLINACNHNYFRANIQKPGPVGGPCLSKDSWILDESAKQLDVDFVTARAARISNENVVLPFFRDVIKNFPEFNPRKICLLGLSFKGNPPTADHRGSAAEELLPHLLQKYPNSEFVGFEESGHLRVDNINQIDDLGNALKNVDFLLILTNSKKFEEIERMLNKTLCAGSIILDYWGILKREQLVHDVHYFAWGNNER